MSEYKGYDLFLDCEDQALQARNRAVVLWNIFESNSKDGRTNARGAADMVGYTREVPEAERKDMLKAFHLFIQEGKS